MKDKRENKCKCPYCDASMEEKNSPLCKACGIKINYCSECGCLISNNIDKCPNCGVKT